MHERKIWELAGKINAGEGTEGEKEELKRLLVANPEIAKDIKIISQFWNYERKKQNLWKLYARYAAILVVLLISSAMVLYIIGPENSKRNTKTIIAANGTKSYLTLPDGSKVWLNAGSTLKYNTVQGNDSLREVFLSGEAYFEVVHKEDLPFVIHTDQMDIKDIGTAFNVRAYPLEGFAETTLIEGSVEIIGKNNKRTLLTEPHQKLTVFDSGDNIQARAQMNTNHQVIPETAWMNGVLIFKNETFQQLSRRMERCYDIRIIFENDTLKTRKITGTFSNETFEEALSSLQPIIRFEYTIEGRQVYIK